MPASIRTFQPRRLLWTACAILLLTACTGGVQPSVSDSAGPDVSRTGDTVAISVSGAFALFPMMTVWTEEYRKLNPNITFDIQAGGAGKGMADMLTGAADIAMLSREPRPEELDQGVFLIPVAIDAVVPTVNANNPALDRLLQTGLTVEQGAAIWLTNTPRTWGELTGTDNAEPVNVYTRSDSSGAAEVWAQFLGGTAQEELQGTAVNGDPGLAEAIRQDERGIGYNNIAFAYDLATGQPVLGIRVVPLDLNGDGQITADEDFYGSKQELVQAIAARTFPYPPARQLYLVTRGEPSPAISAFYRWVLTDGQAFVDEAGYVGLNPQTIEEALARLPEA